ncbi:hypothetical protein GW764_03755 [Candidatus Parcubacteria bacterium]|nr:hypothetical protein [Candidatus Parcubacteria bacterium]
MKFLNRLIRKTIGWVILIIGAFGWVIPIPLVPFFLLFFIGLHILEYDLKFIKLLGRLGIKTDKVEKYLEKTSLSNLSKNKNQEATLENQNTRDPQ